MAFLIPKIVITLTISSYFIKLVIDKNLGDFGYHPLYALVGVLVFAINGIHLMKEKKYHTIHSVINTLAVLFLAGAGFVVYELKEEKSKPHWYQRFLGDQSVSWHAVGGGIVIILWLLQVISAFFTIPPGVEKRYVNYHGQNHAQFGTLNLIFALIALSTGWVKIFGSESPESYLFFSSLAFLLVLSREAKLLRWDQILSPKGASPYESSSSSSSSTTTTTTTTTASTSNPSTTKKPVATSASEDF